MPVIVNMATCPNLAVPAEVMQHIVHVESSSNPFAIGVVGARLQRQPQNLDEAVATARMLESQGYNFSLGIAQVNRYNLAKYGLETYEKAFDVCPNLSAGTRILAQCYAQAGGDWGKSFSCYYSGNFTKGYEDGYVQKVYASIDRASSSQVDYARAIPVQLAQAKATTSMTAEQYRIDMRASAIDALGAVAVCQTAMPHSHASDDDGAIVRNTFPLKFKEHNFGAYCFNTIGCKVFYGGYYAKHKADDEVSPPPSPDYLKNINGSRGGVENFPAPAEVTWHSLDGVAHEAKVDIRAIFKDERVLHHVPEQDIPTETAAFSGPNIILVVNDRTISVYMKTMIYLKYLRDPANPHSNGIEQTTLAYTRTY